MAKDTKAPEPEDKPKKANPGDWTDPKSIFDDDDHSLDAEMSRLDKQESVKS